MTLDFHHFGDRGQVILQATTTARRTQHKSFLESVPTLEQLTEYEILTIADALVEDSYEDGDVICTQGEVGDAFYIIKKVRCEGDSHFAQKMFVGAWKAKL